jgi:hypothetical protein
MDSLCAKFRFALVALKSITGEKLLKNIYL